MQFLTDQIMKANEKIVVAVSGGMDSATLLHDLASSLIHWEGMPPTGAGSLMERVYPITFDYGQRYVRETTRALELCRGLGLSYKIIHVSRLHAILGKAYAPDSPIVPNRNMIMISMAMSYAISLGSKLVLFGVHAEDWEPGVGNGCNPEFIEALATAGRLCWGNVGAGVDLMAPYIKMGKADVLRAGLADGVGVPYHLTWSCHDDGKLACGKCGGCKERLEAFWKIGVRDPLQYAEKNDQTHYEVLYTESGETWRELTRFVYKGKEFVNVS